MSDPILVRSSMRIWDFALLLFTGIGAFVTDWMFVEKGDKVIGASLQVIAWVCVILSTLGMRRRIRLRQWVHLGDDEFTVLDRNGKTDYKDSQVRSFALRHKQNYSEGIVRSVTRTLLIWINTKASESSEFKKLEFKNTTKPLAIDPLATLIDRLSKRVLERARETSSRGEMLSGEGWVLERGNLVVSAKPERLHCSLNDIDATGVVDDKLCLWRKGLDEVSARINIDSVNAYVLMWLIDEHLSQRSEHAASSRAAGGLGRVIFERKTPMSDFVGLGMATVAMFVPGVLLFVTGINAIGPDERAIMLFLGGGLLSAASGCAIAMIHCRIAVFRCHQFGLVKRGLCGERSLRYEHVDRFTFQATRYFYNGAYAATKFRVDFTPDVEHKSQRIRYRASIRKSDIELDKLRDQVAKIIGNRMRQEIEKGGPVVWTRALTFDGAFLIYSPIGLVGRKAPLAIPLTEIVSYEIDQGKFYLFCNGEEKPVVQEDVSTSNFFPGLHCMLSLINLGVAPKTHEA